MELIKQLREITGAGIVDCKKALDEAKNDLQAAVGLLRKRGIAKAAKRMDRETNEGVVKVAINGTKNEAYILSLSSETDFVSRNDKFQAFADAVLNLAMKKKSVDLTSLLAETLVNGSVKEDLDSLSGTIGEKMDLVAYGRVIGASVAAYSHLGGKIGVVLALDQPDKEDLASDLAMQIAATDPRYLEPSEVKTDELEREKDIYKEQLLKEGKPEAMIDKIMLGKISKYYTEVCLLEQEFIKDDKKKVKDLLGSAKIISYLRFSL